MYKTNFAFTTLLLMIVASLAACDITVDSPPPPGNSISDTERDDAPRLRDGSLIAHDVVEDGPIPGPRSCFWLRGPHSADPYINLAYPDSSVFYWAATFSIPKGSTLNIKGEFVHARYQSFISYDERGRPIESLADYLMQPDDGSSNPYRPGVNRNVENRNYSVQILDKAPDAERAIGEYNQDQRSNVLHTPAYGDGQQTILYRIYLPDQGRWPDGGVALPAPVLTMTDGTSLEGKDACNALQTQQPLQISADAAGIPATVYRKLLNQSGKPDTWPAQVPAKWYIQLDRPSLIGIYTGEMSKNPRRSEGGFYPNLDNQYVRTIVNRKHGKIFMLRGKMPTTPKTFNRNDSMEASELRYWSLCSNQGFANTRVNACLFDEEVPLDRNGFYTIMVSRAADRPRNATNACGIAWLPMADDGDGLFDEDVTVVQIRNMLASPDFPHAIQRVQDQDQLEAVMGPYLPMTMYLQPNQVETFFPCYPGSS
ncbi:MAG: hypothetical protein KJO95_05960 [Gammaproteobacteria bacterium]|nr:hypothetical protein [Gammaproteobacteria bacterium]NNC55920.1 hypothetical protein [Woeseiaceae bacterium]